MNSRNRKVAKYRKPIRINVGIVIFSIIVIYILAYTVTYLRKPKISIYEVTEKKIADNNICKAFIIRDEEVVYSDTAGYLNYYLRNGERAAKNTLVYTIDETGEYFKSLNQMNEETSLNQAEVLDIRNDIRSFKSSFDDSNFNEVYNFKYTIENTMFDLTNSNELNNLEGVLESSGNTNVFQSVKTLKSGIISYFVDSLESMSADDVTAELIDNSSEYIKTQLRSDKPVEKNAPVYKIIKSEDWSVIVHLTEEQYEKLQDKERVKITFMKDNISANAGLTIYKKGEEYLAKLSLDRYMIRYINERYLDIELSVNNAAGLKIPVSSVVEKQFFKIPMEYVTEGGNSERKGVVKETYKENGEVVYLFIPTDIYYEEDGIGYIDNPEILLGDTLILSETNEKYKINDVGMLQGVYNVNKGYSVFRRIEIEYGNEEYYIVRKDTSYGLNVYDNIVLDSDTVIEQSIIY